MSSASSQFFAVGELVNMVCAHLNVPDLCAFRSVRRETELRCRQLFTKTCFTQKSVVYTPQGLRRLVDIALNERISTHLTRIGFAFLDVYVSETDDTVCTVGLMNWYYKTGFSNGCCRHTYQETCSNCDREPVSGKEDLPARLVNGMDDVRFSRQQRQMRQSEEDIALLSKLFEALARKEITILLYRRFCTRPLQSSNPSIVFKSSIYGLAHLQGKLPFDFRRVHGEQPNLMCSYDMLEAILGAVAKNKVVFTTLEFEESAFDYRDTVKEVDRLIRVPCDTGVAYAISSAHREDPKRWMYSLIIPYETW